MAFLWLDTDGFSVVIPNIPPSVGFARTLIPNYFRTWWVFLQFLLRIHINHPSISHLLMCHCCGCHGEHMTMIKKTPTPDDWHSHLTAGSRSGSKSPQWCRKNRGESSVMCYIIAVHIVKVMTNAKTFLFCERALFRLVGIRFACFDVMKRDAREPPPPP